MLGSVLYEEREVRPEPGGGEKMKGRFESCQFVNVPLALAK